MRVAYVCTDPGIPAFGAKGCSIHVQEMLRFFRLELGARVNLYTVRPGGTAPAELADVTVRLLPLGGGSGIEREQNLMALNDEVRNRLSIDGPFDLVYERHSLFAFGAMEYARDKSVPGLVEVNAPLIDEQSAHRKLYDPEAAADATRRAFTSASTVVAVSDAVAAYVESRGGEGRNTHVIPNGVDPDRFSPNVAPALKPLPNQFNVGFVGSLKPWHGVTDLVEAFRILADEVRSARLLLVGDGPQRSSIEAAVEAAGLGDAVHVTGAVDHSEVPGWLASMDVAVAPYPVLDSFYFSPLKIFEYMAAGLPVVASATGQIPSVIAHEKTGILLPPGDPEALAAALKRLYLDKPLASSMARSARERAVAAHTWRATGRRILEAAGVIVTRLEVVA